MGTAKQNQANKHNSQNAGVKTDEGKAIVRHNAIKHGLTSKELISRLSNYKETVEDFETILDGLGETFHPRNYFEETLIQKMAKAQLKMRRHEVVEASLFKDDDSYFNRQDSVVINCHNTFELLLKYRQSIEAQYYRALESLYRARQAQQLDLFLSEGF